MGRTDGATRVPCAEPGCVAIAVQADARCAVHSNITRRTPGSAAIHCYACRALIRIGRRWLVRAEGAFHLRMPCLLRDVDLAAVRFVSRRRSR